MQMLDFIWLFLLSCVGAGVIIAVLSVSIHGIYLLLTNPVRYFWRINNRLFGWDYIYWENIDCFLLKIQSGVSAEYIPRRKELAITLRLTN